MQKATERAGLLPVFVYGTLRKGCGLHHAIEPAIQSARFHVWAPGRLHYEPNHLFPIYVHDLDATTRVKGNLFHVNPHSPQWLAVLTMELRAGYDAVWVRVSTDDAQVPALTFTYPGDVIEVMELDPIPGGDWLLATPADGLH